MAKKTKNYSLLFFLVLFFVLLLSLSVLRTTFTSPCANTLSCKESFNFQVDNEDLAIFNATKLQPPKINLDENLSSEKVLGESTSSEDKHIYVDLTTQTLKAYDGSDLFFETKISSGKWFPTPTGDFKIWRMVRATKMSGGEGADYYYLPNVPYVMFYANDKVAAGRGFSLHGTYWHNNFGHAMSHGCVNMRTIDAKKIYEWIDQGSPESVTITINGKAT